MNSTQYATLRKTIGTQTQVAQQLGVSRGAIAFREGGGVITIEAALSLLALSQGITLPQRTRTRTRTRTA